uniref:Putative secreted protein n=1 Tax=Anopheles triannulatus TaxID=58253 RepID=A0A2M4B0P9_9DIPT
MVQLQVHMVLLRSTATALADFDRHRARHNVTRGQILRHRRISLHEALALRVNQITALTTATLGDKTPGTVDTGRVELHKLQILRRKSGARDHRRTIAGTGVGRGAGEVRPSVATGRQHRVLRPEPVNATVLEVHRDHPDTLAILHQQVHGKVFDEVVTVVAQRLAVQRVQQRVSGTIGYAAAPMCLATLAVLQTLATERPLVDLAIGRTRERHAVVFQLDHGLRGLARHVVDRVLIAQPIRTLHRIVHVPLPVVLFHVAQGRIDAALRRDRVRARGEQLRNDGCLEAFRHQTEGRPQSGTTGTDHHRIVRVVHHRVLARDGIRVRFRIVLAHRKVQLALRRSGTQTAHRGEGVLGQGRREPNHPAHLARSFFRKNREKPQPTSVTTGG